MQFKEKYSLFMKNCILVYSKYIKWKKWLISISNKEVLKLENDDTWLIIRIEEDPMNNAEKLYKTGKKIIPLGWIVL